MKIRGTYVLMAWGPALHLSMYTAFLSAAVTLNRWPRPGLDDPKRIEGIWQFTMILFPLILIVGLPLGFLFALISLLRTPRGDAPLARFRLPEWGLGLLLILFFGLIALGVLGDYLPSLNAIWVDPVVIMFWVFAGLCGVSLAFAIVTFVKPPPERETERTQRLLEVALGLVLVPIAYASIWFDPVQAFNWYFD